MCSITQLRDTVEVDLLSLRVREIFDTEALRPISSGIWAWKHWTENSAEIRRAHQIYQNFTAYVHFSQLRNAIEICLLSLHVQEIFDIEAISWGLWARNHLTKNSPEIWRAHQIDQTSQLMCSITQLRDTVEVDLLSLRVREIFDTEARMTHLFRLMGMKTFHRKFTRNLASSANLSNFTADVLANQPENIPPKIHQKFGRLSKFIKSSQLMCTSLSYETQLRLISCLIAFKGYSTLNTARLMQSGLWAWKHSTINSPEIRRAQQIYQTSPLMCSITRLRNAVEIDLLSPRVQETSDTEFDPCIQA